MNQDATSSSLSLMWGESCWMCSQHISALECRGVFLNLPPIDLWCWLSQSPSSTALPCLAMWFMSVMGAAGGKIFGWETWQDMAFPGRCQEDRSMRICRSDPCNPGDFLTVEPLQGMGVTVKCSLRERKNSGGFASIARTTATESIQRWATVTLQSKCNSQMSKLKLRWWLRRGQTCLSSVWKPGGSFAVRPAQRYVVWNHGAVLHHPASPPTRPSCQKSFDHLWLLLLSCSKPFVVETLARHLSSTQNLTHLLRTYSPILPQQCFFHLPLYSHAATHFEWFSLFHPFMLKPLYPLTDVLLCACCSSKLSSDSFLHQCS